MVPGDILIRTAIMAGLDDLRKNSFLLDYVFAWFLNDDLTIQQYGQAEFQRAKKWFLDHEIFVAMNFRADDPKFPIVSIGMQSSSEDTSTLADVNYETNEDVESEEITPVPNILMGPFTPLEYDQTTGLVTLPPTVTTADVFINTVLVDKVNNIGYRIIDVLDSDTFKIEPNINANFTNAHIAPIDNFLSVSLESCMFKQVYSIKCFAQSEPLHLLYLHAIIEYILLKYKEPYLEGRGFDRSIISSGPVYQYQDTGVEMTFGRDITLTGYLRQYWVKSVAPKMQGIKLHGIEFLCTTPSPVSELSNVNAQGWGMLGDFGEIDSLGIK